MSEANPNTESLFTRALALESPADRARYLDQACGADQQLRAQVEELLAAYPKVEQFLESPACAPAATVDEPVRERPGTVIGPYKLLEQIGEGGFGVVFMAEQQQPVRRKVALKVLKPGMDTRQVVARFEAERQALALMDHPHIAHVFDGGETPTGRPYFVMELVKGVPVTDYCDQGLVPPRERLRLFVDVCQAVQHAHQKGIIHRDLKPSNVLVTLQDGRPLVKVIDFGIAKALGQQLTDKTLFTGFAQLVGTPLYMSPEQAALSNTDVDTRSDIYSLGVILYELLTGATPFDKDRLSKAGYDEWRRILREEEPPRPSERISTLGPAAATVATQRRSDPKQLSQLCRGELDWVVMKCLEKDRNRRYESAYGLARDIERYLHDEPVQACPPSAWYRYRKFARRNRRALLTAAALALTALLAVGTLGWVAFDRLARQHETERGATAALAQAELLLAEGDRQTDNPARWQGTVGLADAAVQRAEELLAAGEATAELAGRVRQARAAVEAARTDSRVLTELFSIALEKTAVKGSHFDFARAAARYAAVLGRYGVDPARPAEAAARVQSSRLREALLAALEDWWRVTTDAAERRQVEEVLRAADPAPDAFRARWRAAALRRDGAALARMAGEPGVRGLPAAAVVNLTRDLWLMEEWAAAERLLRAWQERYRNDFWLNHELGFVLMGQNPPRPEEAVPYLMVAVALRGDSPGVYLNLGRALQAKKDLEGAAREYRAALAIDPNYASAHNNLGNVLYAKKDLEGAIREYRAAIKIDPNVALAHNNLGSVLYDQKDLEGAIREYRAELKIDPNNAPAHINLSRVLYAKKDLEGAIRESRAALAIDPNLAPAHGNLGNALRAQKDLEGAIREYRAALAIDPNNAPAHCNLGLALADQKDWEGAVRAYRAALKIDPNLAQVHYNLGLALRAQKDLDGAVREYRAALKIDPNYSLANNNLGNALYDKKDLEGAVRAYRAALAIDPNFASAHYNLGLALRAQKDLDGAIREYQAALAIDPKMALAHHNLGLILYDKKDLDGAIRAFRTALAIDPNLAQTHYILGRALGGQKDLDGAIRAFRAALAIDPNYAQTHFYLGLALVDQGRFADGLIALKTGHQMGSQRPGWPYPSAEWIREVEQFARLDDKLSKVLRGESQPADAAERLQLAGLCGRPYKQLDGAAARFYSEAFAAEPKRAKDLRASLRYNAARAAARAGCGQGKDAAGLGEQERARLRRQALDWLRADLAAWGERLEGQTDPAPAAVLRKMAQWQQDADLAGVRGAAALAGLPEAERRDWQQLWADVEVLRQRAAEAK
jgi:tetratricopeptide (TPR) repeat protein